VFYYRFQTVEAIAYCTYTVQSRAKVFTLLLFGRLCLAYYHTTNTSLIKLLVILKYSVESVQPNDITLIN